MPKVTLKNTQLVCDIQSALAIIQNGIKKKKEIWDKYYNEIANKEIADEEVISGQ
jgi:hypothetical protein